MASCFTDPVRWAIDEDLLFAAQSALGASKADDPGLDLVSGLLEEGLTEELGLAGAASDPAATLHGTADLLALANSTMLAGDLALEGGGRAQKDPARAPAASSPLAQTLGGEGRQLAQAGPEGTASPRRRRPTPVDAPETSPPGTTGSGVGRRQTY